MKVIVSKMIDPKHITFFLFMFYPFCLIDVFNGFMSYHAVNIPLSQIYKMALLGFVLYSLLNTISFYCISLIILSTFFYQSYFYTLSVSEDYATVIRTSLFVFTTSMFYHYRHYLNERHLSLIRNVFLFNFFVIVTSVCSGLFGFGLSTYGGQPASQIRGVGFKGYFYAGNELGALLLCLFPILFVSIYSKINKLIISILFIFVSFLIGTKTAFISILILGLYSIFTLANISIVKKIGIFLSVTFFSVFILLLFQEQIGHKIETLKFVYNNKGLMYLILSGRDSLLLDAYTYISSNFSIYDFLLGIGSSFAASKFKSVEMDFADILIWSGFFWMLFIYIFYFVFSYYVLIRFSKKTFNVFFLTLAFLLLASFFAGHVLTSGMLLPILSLYLPFSYLYGKLKYRVK